MLLTRCIPIRALWPVLCLSSTAAFGQEATALTNLATVPSGLGLPDGWTLRQTRAAPPPLFAVTADHALRLEAVRSAGFALLELPEPLPRVPGVAGWRWRTATPIPGADLRSRAADDSPVRVLVAFTDRRTLFYSWASSDSVGSMFTSWTGRSRAVVVLRTAADADGEWRHECRDPFSDYHVAFGREAPAIAAVGVSADTEQLAATTWAEVADILWWPATPDAAIADRCPR